MLVQVTKTQNCETTLLIKPYFLNKKQAKHKSTA